MDFSEWVALSYCWGGDQPQKTTQASIPGYRDGIDLSSMPKTIQDAVTVCRKIGARYLWVDSLCIIQNDTADLGVELGQVPRIYQSALVTIFAASAHNVTEGFLHPRFAPPADSPPIKVRVQSTQRTWLWGKAEESIHQLVLADTESEFAPSPVENPLYRRAWAYQEYMLSPRMLVYSDKELTWRCRCGERRLGSRLLQTERMSNKPSIPGSRLNWWDDIIEAYTQCDLTLPSDKLVALAALADFYQKETNKTYLAGLWKEDIIQGLWWRLDGRRMSLPKLKRPPEYRAPSWSWASVDGAVKTDLPPTEYSPTFVAKAQLVKAHVNPLYPAAPLVAVKSASLTIFGGE
ncbi:heterokaryon incompatibility protein-domain-containing protein [Bombardia bombarda]|uniref:Heterokaryon incompatibility protein-domain-containing protein n=1 Tax=Bombardia bombarda TaxID=252184 RepID=A0AA39WUV7_9PEZI|nr:heterokaryon incompatibility protein-domain-containing protein [Bombardia bombarda]